MGLLRLANELGRRNGLLRGHPLLRKSVLVGRILSGISTRVSSTVLPTAETTDATSGGLATTPAGKQTAVPSAVGRKASGNISATKWRKTAGTTDGRKASTAAKRGKTTRRGKTARRRQPACEHSTGAATAAIATWRAGRTSYDSTNANTTADNAASWTGEHERIARIPTEHAKSATSGPAKCIFRLNRRQTGERARQSQLKSAQGTKRTAKGECADPSAKRGKKTVSLLRIVRTGTKEWR
jgi:hypothetical protein